MKKQILLIDDDTAPIHYYLRALRDAGFTVEQKKSAEEALEYVKTSEERIDLVILDIMMPGGDAYPDEETDEGMTTGLFLLKEISAKLPDVPVLILTNVKSLDVGADERLTGRGGEIFPKIEMDPFSLVERVRMLLKAGT